MMHPNSRQYRAVARLHAALFATGALLALSGLTACGRGSPAADTPAATSAAEAAPAAKPPGATVETDGVLRWDGEVVSADEFRRRTQQQTAVQGDPAMGEITQPPPSCQVQPNLDVVCEKAD